jgi:hypothetical protein
VEGEPGHGSAAQVRAGPSGPRDSGEQSIASSSNIDSVFLESVSRGKQHSPHFLSDSQEAEKNRTSMDFPAEFEGVELLTVVGSSRCPRWLANVARFRIGSDAASKRARDCTQSTATSQRAVRLMSRDAQASS